MIGTSALEVVSGVVIAAGVVAGTVAGGWVIIAGTAVGAGVGSLIAAHNSDYDAKAWLQGMVEGAATGAVTTVLTAIGIAGAGSGFIPALAGVGSEAFSMAAAAETTGVIVEAGGIASIGGTVVYAATEKGTNLGKDLDDQTSQAKRENEGTTLSEEELAGKWNEGSFDSSQDSIEYHFNKHGDEVGAKTVEEYLKKAESFSTNLKGAKSKPVDGFVDGVTRYFKNGKYIDIAPDGTIVSFGAQ